MSSNKKQKLEFKDALKAKGARPASEAAVVEVHGVPTTIIRGNMSESAWAQIKARELPEKAIQNYEETGSLPKVDKAAARQAEKDAQFQEETGAAPQNVSQAPTDLVPADMGMTPAEAMAPVAPVETVTTPTGDVIEKPPPPPEAVPPPPPEQPGVRTLEPMTMDAGGPPPEEPFKLPSVKEGLTGLAQAQIKSLEGAQAIAEKQAEAEKALRQQHIIDSLQAQAHQKEVQDAYNSKMDQLERAGIDLRDQMMEASRATVDPNRYWANKDAGQKAAAVIAGALFGFTGQGMQWLQRLDGLVAQDMQAQAADLANRGHMLQAAAGQNNNLIAQLKSRGVEGMAAYQTGMALMKEDLANRIELMKLNTSSANARAMLDEKKSQLLADAAINAQKAQQAQETHALNSAKTIAEIQKLRADAAQSASPRPKSLSELTIARHDSIKNSLAGLEELKASFDRLKGGASALGRAGQVVKAHAPLLGSEEKAYNTQVQLLASEVAKARSATGTTSENDEKKAVEDLFKAGDSVAEQKYNALKRDLERRLKQSEASLQAGGFDTSSTVAPSGMVPVRPPMKASK